MTTTIERQERELKATQEKLERLTKQIADTKRRFTNDQAAIIDALPKRLGLPNLEAVRSMIHAREKGEFGSLIVAPKPPSATQRARFKFTDESRAALDKLIEAGELTAKQMARAIGCGVPTVNTHKGELRRANSQPAVEPPAESQNVA